MPESRIRRKSAYTPPARRDDEPKAVKIGSRWTAPIMVTLFIVGLLWIVVWYIDPTNPVMERLSYWNVVIGFALIGGGFAAATRWR